MAVIEAMAAGKPVVATRVGGVPNLVDDGGSGFLVQPDDVASFAQSVADLLADKDLRHRMGQRARKLAERFRTQTVASRYRDLYYQVAGRAAP
jgi:glycosyltransferase involved in cell wall biosynthesis